MVTETGFGVGAGRTAEDYGQQDRGAQGADGEQRRCAPEPEHTIGGLLRGLIDDTRSLLRQELQLARAEISEKAAEAGRRSAMVGVGAVVGLGGVMAIIAAACCGLWAALVAADVDHEIAVWLAPLIVGLVVALIGYALIQSGLSALRRMRMVPDKTARSLKETGRWIQEKVA